MLKQSKLPAPFLHSSNIQSNSWRPKTHPWLLRTSLTQVDPGWPRLAQVGPGWPYHTRVRLGAEQTRPDYEIMLTNCNLASPSPLCLPRYENTDIQNKSMRREKLLTSDIKSKKNTVQRENSPPLFDSLQNLGYMLYMFRCQINRSFRRAKITHRNNFQTIIFSMQST